MSTQHFKHLFCIPEFCWFSEVGGMKFFCFTYLSVSFLSAGDVTNAMDAIAKVVVESADPTKTANPSGESVINVSEDTAGHLVLKKLILNDKERLQQGKSGKWLGSSQNASSHPGKVYVHVTVMGHCNTYFVKVGWVQYTKSASILMLCESTLLDQDMQSS